MRTVPETRRDCLRAILVIAASPFVAVVLARYFALVSYSSAAPRSDEFFIGRDMLRVIEGGVCMPLAIVSALLTALLSFLYIRFERGLAGWGFVVLAVFGFIACAPTVLRHG